jgi:phosphate:Na+ symporter
MKRLDKDEIDFSEDAWKDLIHFHHEVFAFFILVCQVSKQEDCRSAHGIYEAANRLNDLADAIRIAHLDRMKAGSCGALQSLTFSDMAVALRRIKNHTVNLDEALCVEASSDA